MNDLSTAPKSERQRKPDWIRVKAPTSQGYGETRKLMRDLKLNTVCEEAACPNIGECWTKKHATVMILGDVCTRACAFCNVKTGMPRAVDPLEPEHVAIAAAKMGLEHIVITSVDRDDLPDGGAGQFVKVIKALRAIPSPLQPKAMFCTSKSGAHDIHLGISAGADEYITKPFDESTMTAKLLSIGAI